MGRVYYCNKFDPFSAWFKEVTPASSTYNFVYIYINFFALLVDVTQQLRREKSAIFLIVNISFIHNLKVSIDVFLNGFLRVTLIWYYVSSFKVFSPGNNIFCNIP